MKRLGHTIKPDWLEKVEHMIDSTGKTDPPCVWIGSKKFIFAHAVHLQGIRAKFVYEGHRVKVKVIGAKKVENSSWRSWGHTSPQSSKVL